MSKPLKIALVSNTTWNIHNFRLNIISKLLHEGHEVIVMAPVDEYIHYKENFPQVKHVPIRKLDRDSINPIKDLKLAIELSNLYAKVKPDFIVHYTVKPNIYGGIAARFNKIPSVAVVTGLGFAFIHNGFIKKVTQSLYKISAGGHLKFIFENDADKVLFEETGLIKKGQGASVKGCGVDTNYFLSKTSLQDKNGRTIFTFIGRLLYDKGVKEFIEAAHIVKSKFSDSEFWLIGEIDKENPSAIKEDDLVDWIRGTDIQYHGSTRDVRKYIDQSDCIVLPSYREGMSRIIMEGMSMERPIITTDTPGCRETVENGKNGFVVPVKNSLALSEAMIKLYHLSPEERKQMGEYGRQKAINEFSESKIAEDFYHILSDVF
ncbi:MAG: glycosyltransferase family 4 protein [Saprospiraceae bacterium]|nr:glycosyltransferase family 4 protein [Saprospiraceae bacterium]